MRVNLDLFHDVVLVDKVRKVQRKLGGFLTSLFTNKDLPEEHRRRFIAFSEGRLLVVSGTGLEQVRNYGSHFNMKDKERLNMPRITWNGQVLSARPLRDLLVIRLLNYKQVLQRVKEAPEERGAPVRMQLEWGGGDASETNPYKEQEVKTYLVDRFGLQVFIQAI